MHDTPTTPPHAEPVTAYRGDPHPFEADPQNARRCCWLVVPEGIGRRPARCGEMIDHWTHLPRRVSQLGEIERRYSEALHDESCDDPPGHGLVAHEPFDLYETDEPWSAFEARLARHGLRLVSSATPIPMRCDECGDLADLMPFRCHRHPGGRPPDAHTPATLMPVSRVRLTRMGACDDR